MGSLSVPRECDCPQKCNLFSSQGTELVRSRVSPCLGCRPLHTRRVFSNRVPRVSQRSTSNTLAPGSGPTIAKRSHQIGSEICIRKLTSVRAQEEQRKQPAPLGHSPRIKYRSAFRLLCLGLKIFNELWLGPSFKYPIQFIIFVLDS